VGTPERRITSSGTTISPTPLKTTALLLGDKEDLIHITSFARIL